MFTQGTSLSSRSSFLTRFTQGRTVFSVSTATLLHLKESLQYSFVEYLYERHAFVNEGPSGTAEIAKIYAALDYDYDSKTYGDNPTPVKWVRVHNLPDLAYFNHSQHVVAGQIECEQCHGEMSCMGVAEQHSPLTMGWCINCHRETSVQVADNAYYEDLISRMPHIHDGEVVTVETIGGLECAKCHY